MRLGSIRTDRDGGSHGGTSRQDVQALAHHATPLSSLATYCTWLLLLLLSVVVRAPVLP